MNYIHEVIDHFTDICGRTDYIASSDMLSSQNLIHRKIQSIKEYMYLQVTLLQHVKKRQPNLCRTLALTSSISAHIIIIIIIKGKDIPVTGHGGP
jgi:hypothetical protein